MMQAISLRNIPVRSIYSFLGLFSTEKPAILIEIRSLVGTVACNHFAALAVIFACTAAAKSMPHTSAIRVRYQRTCNQKQSRKKHPWKSS